MKINLEIIHKEIILIEIKDLSQIKTKVVIVMIHIIKNPMIILDNTRKIAIIKETRDMKNTDI